MIDLKKKPFFLDEEACQWVKKTLEGMSDEEKVGQLFCEILWDRPGREPEDLFEVLDALQESAVRYCNSFNLISVFPRT